MLDIPLYLGFYFTCFLLAISRQISRCDLPRHRLLEHLIPTILTDDEADTMAFRVLRPAALAAQGSRRFHSTPRAFVRVGDPIPNLAVLVESSPGNKVNLAEEFKKSDGLIIGVPAAFSGACSQQHVPSYMSHPAIKRAGQVFVVSVNDAFVYARPSPVAPTDPADADHLQG